MTPFHLPPAGVDKLAEGYNEALSSAHAMLAQSAPDEYDAIVSAVAAKLTDALATAMAELGCPFPEIGHRVDEVVRRATVLRALRDVPPAGHA